MQCNKIMEVKNVHDVVVTHRDCEEVFLWNFERQAQANAQNKARAAPTLCIDHMPALIATQCVS